MILYAISLETRSAEDRWKDTGIREEFYAELDEARQAVLELRKDLAAQKDESPVGPICIERVELDEPTPQSVLTLLNRGIGPLVRHYEVVETNA